jgi:uncharacterized membrane protein YjgN (DUF898 family)
MKSNKWVLAWLIGFIVMFLVSGLWYLMLMADYNSVQFSEVQRAEFKTLWIIIGYIVGAFLLAIIYPIGYKGGAPIKEGLRFGLLMGLVIALPYGLVLHAIYMIPLEGALVNTIYQVVEKCIGGMVIGLVYGIN